VVEGRLTIGELNLAQLSDSMLQLSDRVALLEAAGPGGGTPTHAVIVVDSGLENGGAIIARPVSIHIEYDDGTVVPWDEVVWVYWGDGTHDRLQTHNYGAKSAGVFITVTVHHPGGGAMGGTTPSFVVRDQLTVVFTTGVEGGVARVNQQVIIEVSDSADNRVLAIGEISGIQWADGYVGPVLFTHTYLTARANVQVYVYDRGVSPNQKIGYAPLLQVVT
jgi:hypothetical protein